MIKIPVGFIRRDPHGYMSEDEWWTKFTEITFEPYRTWKDVEDIITEWGGKYYFDEAAGEEWIEFKNERDANWFKLRWL